MTKEKFSLTIGWLYPDLMSTYGDRGNVMILAMRARWRNVSINVTEISTRTDGSEIASADILFMGGAQDRQQEIVKKDLIGKKEDLLHEAIEGGTPGLFVCGAYQFLGAYYIAADGTKIDGLGIYDLTTQSPGIKAKRLIGDIIIKPRLPGFEGVLVVGFENHGGRTTLGDAVNPFADVVWGYGNNGEDKTEGVIYKNSIGTYLHGPILSKNPDLADHLIKTAIHRKYGINPELARVNDFLEQSARETIIRRYLT